MSDVIIHGLAPSSYTRTVRMACWEKGISHQLVPADLRADGYVEIHPFGKVPTLDHGDVRLYETTAILRYVDDVFDGPSLTPAAPRERAEMEKWLSILNCYLYGDAVRDIVLQYVFPRGPDGTPDEATIDGAVPRVRRDLGLLDRRLTGRDWIAGDAISLADLGLVTVVASLSRVPVADAVLDGAPSVRRWLAAIAERDSFRRAHAELS